LIRPSDRWETVAAVMVIAAAIASIGGALWLGSRAAESSQRRNQSPPAGGGYRAVAAVSEPGRPLPAPAGADVPGATRWAVPVVWAAPDGTRHNGVLRLSCTRGVGSPVHVAVAPNGAVTTSSTPDPRAAGVVVGALGLLTAWAVLAGIWVLTVHRIIASNCRKWESEWRRVEPRWSGRVR
jgi:hypothetical protein